jgi:3'-phosphoadenosine 5'-phosphosulfate sulfotransferase (PAPS reductase)/FAD synthetase
MGEWEWNELFDCDVWRPIISWSEGDVIDRHLHHGVHPNPLYLKGAERVGCWPCIFSRKKEIQFIADQTPDTINAIRQLEAEVVPVAAARYASKGETFESLGYGKPAFFQGPSNENADGAGKWNPWPIDRVVLWSRTARGGKQFELFAPETEAGCVRWGLCESMQKDEEDAA